MSALERHEIRRMVREQTLEEYFADLGQGADGTQPVTHSPEFLAFVEAHMHLPIDEQSRLWKERGEPR